MSERDDLLRCSFCGKTQKQVHKLIAGPGVYICEDDVGRAAGLGRSATRDEKCGFCGKTGAQVSWLWQIPDASICNECVGLCNEIIREELRVVDGEERAEVEATVTAEATVTTDVAGARCPSCRARLSDTARSQIVDVPAGDGTEGARVLFLYCAGCGLTIDDVMLPEDR